MKSNAMEAPAFAAAPAVQPVEVGPSSRGGLEDEVLTDEDLAAWLHLPVDEKGKCKWIEKNAQAGRIPGQFKAGRYRRYRKDAILRQILKTGEALLPKGEA